MVVYKNTSSFITRSLKFFDSKIIYTRNFYNNQKFTYRGSKKVVNYVGDFTI